MNVHRSSCNVPVVVFVVVVVVVVVVRLQSNLNFLSVFSKNARILKFMKICPLKPSCSMRKDGHI
jgi:hypothetical protein